jgi:chromate transporter
MISAASVGVIGQLAVWFAVHVLFGSSETFRLGLVKVAVPEPSSLDPAAVGLTVLALALTFALRLPVLALVGAMVVAGLALKGVGLA